MKTNTIVRVEALERELDAVIQRFMQGGQHLSPVRSVNQSITLFQEAAAKVACEWMKEFTESRGPGRAGLPL
jgi:hypothetical protein